MGQQRGTKGPKLAYAGKGLKEKSATPSMNRAEQPVDGVQEILGSRAGSRALRSEGQHQGEEVAPQDQGLQQLLQSVSPVSLRVQAKPFFGGVSQAWGGGATAGLVIQQKLTVGAAGDKYEQEADRVAAEVVDRINAPSPQPAGEQPSVQRMGDADEELQMMRSPNAIQRLDEAEEELQMKPIAEPIRRMGEEEDELQMTPMVQRVGAEGGSVSADLEGEINSARGGGQQLAPQLQAKMGQAMGADFSGVRVHTDRRSDLLNRSIQARAFTTGQDVFFRQGAYEQGNRGGQELIAHELTHVLQQKGCEESRSARPPNDVRLYPATETSRASEKQKHANARNVIQRDLVPFKEPARPHEQDVASIIDDAEVIHQMVQKAYAHTIKEISASTALVNPKKLDQKDFPTCGQGYFNQMSTILSKKKARDSLKAAAVGYVIEDQVTKNVNLPISVKAQVVSGQARPDFVITRNGKKGVVDVTSTLQVGHVMNKSFNKSQFSYIGEATYPAIDFGNISGGRAPNLSASAVAQGQIAIARNANRYVARKLRLLRENYDLMLSGDKNGDKKFAIGNQMLIEAILGLPDQGEWKDAMVRKVDTCVLKQNVLVGSENKQEKLSETIKSAQAIYLVTGNPMWK